MELRDTTVRDFFCATVNELAEEGRCLRFSMSHVSIQ